MFDVYTIGHSNHSAAHFLELLKAHSITAIADVRSSPVSRIYPHFSRNEMQKWLRDAGVKYVFMGDEFGARPKDRSCYVDGKARYERIAETAAFSEGVRRIQEGRATHRIALLCAEKDPLTCHRTILVARRLADAGMPLQHILHDGALESHDDAKKRLLREVKAEPSGDLFRPTDSIVASAFDKRAEKIMYVEPAWPAE